MFRPTVEEMLADLLSNLPAPQFYDADGRLPVPFQIESFGSVHRGNRITL